MARNCPACSMEMRVETVHGVQLDICPRCAGIWFNAEELRTLLAQDPIVLSELEDETVPQVEQKPGGPSTQLCPDCKLPLQHYHYLYNSPIVLEACPNCGGFFVENGELGKMQQWLDQAHQPMSADEKARVTLAEDTFAHDSFMLRQKNLQYFFNILRRYQPGWIGLLP